GDKVNRDKYLAIGKELYPNDSFWCEAELLEANDDKKKMFVIYDRLLSGPCGTYKMYYNYAVDLFNYSYAGDTPVDFAVTQARLTEILKKTLAINSTAEANLLMSRHIFASINKYYDAIADIKGT